MTHSNAQMTEDSLSDLVKAGFTVDVKIYGFGAEATFSVSIKKDNPAYGPGLEIRAEGKGADGAAALRGAVATAETFLYAVPPRRKPTLASFDLPEPPAAPEVPDVDPVEARRAANRDHAEKQDERARGLVAVDEELTF